MSEFSKLEQAISDLTVKVDGLIAKASTPPPDDQPAIDAVTAQVEALAAKIPA